MKSFLRFNFICIITLSSFYGDAQYCIPAINTTGVFIARAQFTSVGGPTYNTSDGNASEGYANRSASSSGTVSRNCSSTFSYSFQSCGNQGAKTFNFRVYADWNQDNDFDDANEMVAEITGSFIDGNCAFSNSTVTINTPINALTGMVRLRWALREGGGIATACGGYTGEVEDYSIMVSANIAPVISSGGRVFLDPLVETQTNNDGISIGRLTQTTSPGVTLITDADQCPSIKNIALIGTSGSGTWQYKIHGGSWTDVESVSDDNALLLDELSYTRFVPSGAGTAGITFRAWDKSKGTSGQVFNIAATGDTTPFSTGSRVAELTIYSAASAASDVLAYMPTAGATGGDYNIISSSIGRATGIFKHINNTTTDSISGYGMDITLDEVNNKLYWVGGAAYNDVMRSNTDGSNIEILNHGAFANPTGIAIGGNKVFVIDYNTGIFSMNPDGSGLTAITGNEGQVANIATSGDIEYDGGKIYYINKSSAEGASYEIVQANPDGTGTVSLVSLSSTPGGLDVLNGMLYWSEFDGGSGYIRTRAVSGGDVTTLLTSPAQIIFDLEASPGNNKIYFVDSDNMGYNPYINSIPIAGGDFTRELAVENNVYSLVFSRELTALPVHFVNVKAYPKNSQNMVEWNIAEEDNVNHYIIQRSGDGVNFNNAQTIVANHSGHYQWPDNQPLTGNSFYRISAIDNDGKQVYSSLVVVNRLVVTKSLSVMPSVITENQFSLKLQNLVAGSYQLDVISSSGQKVYQQRIVHSGGTTVQNVALPADLSRGVYRVVVTGNNELFTSGVLLR